MDTSHDQSDESLATNSNHSSTMRYKLERKSQQGFSGSSSTGKKNSDNAKTPIEFNDMCDNVIDIILCNLRLDDLANVSDTNQRLKNIAGSVFSRKHGCCLIAFETFHYTHEISGYSHKDYNKILTTKKKPIIRISKAEIWFKILRNFGHSAKFIAIQCDCITERVTKIPNALKNLNEYIHEYCTDALEILELSSYKFFTLNKPLRNLHEFLAGSGLDSYGCIEEWKHWNPLTLHFMPNLRSLDISGVPIALEKHLPQLECFDFHLKNEEEVHSFISLLHLNPQIKYLNLVVRAVNCDDLVFSAIEKNLTQLKNLHLEIWGDRKSSDIAIPYPKYRFKTVQSFSYYTVSFPSVYSKIILKSFKFDELMEFELGPRLNSKWMNFIIGNKKLKIFKFGIWSRNWRKNKRAAAIKQLANLPELEQIIIREDKMENHLIYKTILGAEWEHTEVREQLYKPKLFFAKYERVLKNLNA